jgi:thioredoxin 1
MLEILDFHAIWCGPCKMLSPVLDEIQKTNSDINIRKINTDENKEMTQQYNVVSVPTVVFVKDNKEISRFNGFKSKDYIQSLINQYK